jgi:hypothetical protein
MNRRGVVKTLTFNDLKAHLKLKTSGVENIQLVWIDNSKKHPENEIVLSEIKIPKGHDPLERRF